MRRIRPISHASPQWTWSSKVGALRQELPNFLGVTPSQCNAVSGLASRPAKRWSATSDREFMMSYTVMGDTVNLASRPGSTNKVYGSRCLVSEATVAAAKDATVEVREIDRVVNNSAKANLKLYSRSWGEGARLGLDAMLLWPRYAEGLTAYRAERWDRARARHW